MLCFVWSIQQCWSVGWARMLLHQELYEQGQPSSLSEFTSLCGIIPHREHHRGNFSLPYLHNPFLEAPLSKQHVFSSGGNRCSWGCGWNNLMALLSWHSNGFQERGCQTLPSATQYKRLLENQLLDHIFWMLFQEARAEAFIKYIPFLFFFFNWNTNRQKHHCNLLCFFDHGIASLLSLGKNIS